MNIAQFWEACLKVSYNEKKLLTSLDGILKNRQPKRILDCACGTGFLTLDLIARGYDITCSDGSKQMLREFRKNAQRKKVSVKPRLLKWEQLAKNFPQEFDFVMCRGSSLIYASGWDRSRKQNEHVIRESISNFYQCLSPGGVLYVDTTAATNLKASRPERNRLRRQVEGSVISLDETVVTDKKNALRTWESSLDVDGESFKLRRYSHYLPHGRLKSLLRGCGFKRIRKVAVSGEHYDVFLAEK